MTPEVGEQPTEGVRKKSRSTAYTIFTLVLAAELLFLALRGISWNDLAHTLLQARWQYLVLLVIVSSTSLFLRAVRWGVLVSAETSVPPFTMFWITAIGYMGNNFLPARAGELIRSILLGQKAKISVGYVFATAMTERILDAITLVVIGLVFLPATPGLSAGLTTALNTFSVLGIVALAALLTAPRWGTWLSGWVCQIHLPNELNLRLAGIITQLTQGAQAFVNLRRMLFFAGLTAMIWLCDGMGTVILGLGLNLHLSLPQGLLLLVALGLSSAIPSTPGYVGVYQFVAVTVLPLFGLTRSQALTYILASQAINVAMISLWGLIGMAQLGVHSLKIPKEQPLP
jgi:glycosyltransferase 2 family protein